MNRIQLLDPLVAERIAAGEVIERPSSIVKELVENAIDAGATEISVHLIEGGKSLIEVIDNGHGMSRDDLSVCVLRHATSKISRVEDLEQLQTLGFRGEALPSIAAVAELTILSREKDQEAANLWKNSKIEPTTFGHFIDKPHGTRMQVSGLFSQIPARLKFLKSSSAEVSQVREWLERLALSHPEIGFKLTHESKTLLSLRRDTEPARVLKILGDGENFPVVSQESIEAGAIKVRAHWLQGLSVSQMRKVIQIVNGRAVKDRLIQQAILSPFRQALLPGQFPALVLYVDLPPQLLDVNVHPTKTELRFLNSSQIYRSVESLLERMISENGVMGFAQGRSPGLFREWKTEAQPLARESNGYNDSSVAFAPPSSSSFGFSPPASETFTRAPTFNLEQKEPQPNTISFTESHPFRSERFVGTLFQTYLMYDLGEELALIDQHAAHERIRFEKLKKRASDRAENGYSQSLLIPEAVAFLSENRIRLEQRLPVLEKIGFEAEIFGDDKLLYRSVPSEWGNFSLKTRLQNLTDRLLSFDEVDTSRLIVDETLFEKLASEACHSAVRAGDRLDPTKTQSIVDELFTCSHPWNCPHGRPTIARVPRARFEEWFQRRV